MGSWFQRVPVHQHRENAVENPGPWQWSIWQMLLMWCQIRTQREQAGMSSWVKNSTELSSHPSPSDLFPPGRSHLLRIPHSPEITQPAGKLVFQMSLWTNPPDFLNVQPGAFMTSLNPHTIIFCIASIYMVPIFRWENWKLMVTEFMKSKTNIITQTFQSSCSFYSAHLLQDEEGLKG